MARVLTISAVTIFVLAGLVRWSECLTVFFSYAGWEHVRFWQPKVCHFAEHTDIMYAVISRACLQPASCWNCTFEVNNLDVLQNDHFQHAGRYKMSGVHMLVSDETTKERAVSELKGTNFFKEGISKNNKPSVYALMSYDISMHTNEPRSFRFPGGQRLTACLLCSDLYHLLSNPFSLSSPERVRKGMLLAAVRIT